MSKIKKPKDTDDLNIDIYFEQFSVRGDLPIITVNNESDCYEFHPNHDVKSELKKMRRDAEWLLKAANYIEQELLGE